MTNRSRPSPFRLGFTYFFMRILLVKDRSLSTSPDSIGPWIAPSLTVEAREILVRQLWCKYDANLLAKRDHQIH